MGGGKILPEIITLTSDEPWAADRGVRPHLLGRLKLEGGGRSAGSLAGDVLRGGRGAGAGVSPCLLHQDSRQTPEHLCIQLHLQQAQQDIYIVGRKPDICL